MCEILGGFGWIEQKAVERTVGTQAFTERNVQIQHIFPIWCRRGKLQAAIFF